MPARPPLGDRRSIGPTQEPGSTDRRSGAGGKEIAMKALALRLVALALPIALFLVAAAPRLRI